MLQVISTLYQMYFYSEDSEKIEELYEKFDRNIQVCMKNGMKNLARNIQWPTLS